MDAGEIDYYAPDCPDDYEIVAQAYWMGFKTGCICTSGSGYSEIDDVVCTDDMLQQGCDNVKESFFTRLPVIDGNKICAKRDKTYTYLTIEKPINKTNPDGTWAYTCTNPDMPKLCGNNQVAYKNAFCIP